MSANKNPTASFVWEAAMKCCLAAKPGLIDFKSAEEMINMTSKYDIDQSKTHEMQQSFREKDGRIILKGLLASGAVTIANSGNVEYMTEKVAEANGGKNLYQKIIGSYLKCGKMTSGSEIGISTDPTLTQNSLGTMVYLQFSVPTFRTKLSVTYTDHNKLEDCLKNTSYDQYKETMTEKYCISSPKTCNEIYSQVNMEQFSHADWTLNGSDNHLSASESRGKTALNIEKIERLSFMIYPQVMRINLNGHIADRPLLNEVILEVLRLISLNGNGGLAVEYGGWAVEYGGSGLTSLSVLERQAIANMGSENGLAISLFPNDQVTKGYLKVLGREYQWVELAADANATYDKVVNINLTTLGQYSNPLNTGLCKKRPGRPRKPAGTSRSSYYHSNLDSFYRETR